ncbi:molybdopterin molybdotransferase MoeA [Acidobacteria bacterium AB60]|nr:molybdopterin molybdotransferase MoeA [Acidobacteria bacterium AB60]
MRRSTRRRRRSFCLRDARKPTRSTWSWLPRVRMQRMRRAFWTRPVRRSTQPTRPARSPNRFSRGCERALPKGSALLVSGSAAACCAGSSTIFWMATGLPSYDEAATLIAAYSRELHMRPFATEVVGLRQAAGRVAAKALLADREMPAFPRSTRDGFACKAAEASSHEFLFLAGSTRAGDAPTGLLPAASVWEIMTGAAVPAGADAVAMLEHVEQVAGKVRLIPPRVLEPGENVVPVGVEARTGEEVVPAGSRLTASQIAAAAACGYSSLEVFKKPRVAILTTGDELVGVDQTPGPGKIRNSNAPMLAALVEQACAEPWVLPVVRDNGAEIETALREAIQADMVLISGGVSAGKFDLVEPALAQIGARVHFTGVRIQPGKPLVFCEVPRNESQAVPVFGLPGNPISSAATFLLFAHPVLSGLAGSNEVRPRFSIAVLTREVKGKSGLTRFVPSACAFHAVNEANPEVAPVNWQGSGDLAAFARANCFAVVPEGIDRLSAGDLVRILPFF